MIKVDNITKHPEMKVTDKRKQSRITNLQHWFIPQAFPKTFILTLTKAGITLSI